MERLRGGSDTNHASPNRSAREESPSSRSGAGIFEVTSEDFGGQATTHVPPESDAPKLRTRAAVFALIALVRAWCERFDAKVEVTAGCHHWRGARQTKGYGSFSAGGEKTVLAHRFAWEREVGPLPEEMTIDHVACGNRCCVNVWHMEVVTRAENSRRANRVRVSTWEAA